MVKVLALIMCVIVKWLHRAPTLFECYYKLSYLEDNEAALATSWYELMDVLNKLLAREERTTSFFARHSIVPVDYEPSPLSQISSEDFSHTFTFLLNVFVKEGGLTALLKIIQNGTEGTRVPFEFVHKVLMYYLSPFLEPTFAAAYFAEFTDSIFKRVEMVSNMELKVLKYEDILCLFAKLRTRANGLNENKLEQSKLCLLLKMLKCPYLEKRIKGLNEISSLIEYDYRRFSISFDSENKHLAN